MKINKCRACENNNLSKCLDLGNQYLTGVFPKNKNQNISIGNLSLVYCNKCSLLQLSENFNRFEMYGSNYGYMSSLNPTMIIHLKSKAMFEMEFAVSECPGVWLMQKRMSMNFRFFAKCVYMVPSRVETTTAQT